MEGMQGYADGGSAAEWQRDGGGVVAKKCERGRRKDERGCRTINLV